MVHGKSLLDLLEAVDEVTTTLCGEKYSTISWYLPLLFGLLEATEPAEHDSQLLKSLKNKLKTELLSRFNLKTLKMDSLPVLAAALDPRFKRLTFLTAAQQQEVGEALMEKANEDSKNRTDPEVEVDASEPHAKRKQQSIMDKLPGEEGSEDASSHDVGEEI